MEKDHRALTLHVGILDPKVESILVHRSLKAELGRLGNGSFRRNVVIKLHEGDLPSLGLVGVPGREVFGGHTRVGVRVLAGLHEFLGRSAVSGRDPVAPRGAPHGHSVAPRLSPLRLTVRLRPVVAAPPLDTLVLPIQSYFLI